MKVFRPSVLSVEDCLVNCILLVHLGVGVVGVDFGLLNLLVGVRV